MTCKAVETAGGAGAPGCKGWRLPTEAEWEYAARAGTETRFHAGDRDEDLARAGWYWSNADQRTHPVGEKEANAWGLVDVHGNVWEWTYDCYDAGFYGRSPPDDPVASDAEGCARVVRGGAWNYDAGYARAADRSRFDPAGRFSLVGFRCARGM
jgi:formylglycine-generating enzyme required for sulfatase activity